MTDQSEAESARYCPGFRDVEPKRADDPDSECCSVPLPAGGHLVTWILIATNCLVFLFQDSLSPDELELFLRQFALIPARYSEALASGESDLAAVDFVPFFTMMFLHGGWLHLILNMWTLWLFGRALEDRLGHLRYLAFYLACGLAASASHVMFNPTSIIPALGASGAIAGLLGCYMFPMARVVVVVPILFIPLFFEVYAFVFIGLWFLIQFMQSMMALLLPSASGDVAWWAQVGAFIAGVALGPFLVRSEQRYRVYYPDEGVFGFDTKGRI